MWFGNLCSFSAESSIHNQWAEKTLKLSVLYKFPWKVEFFKFVPSYLGHHWSLFGMERGGVEKK